MLKSVYLFVIFSLLFSSCEIPNEKSQSLDKKGLRVARQYWKKGGELKTEITYKGKKKHGPAKSYYRDGKLRQELHYLNNVKHGDVITYYENGNKYQITPYVNGQLEGVRKKYRMDGRLVAEVPYHKGKACRGLKEYLLNDQVKKGYPKIVVKEIDNTIKDNQFIVEISVSDKSKKVKYYIGKIDESGCIAEDAVRFQSQRPGVLQLKYRLAPGMFLMEELNIIAVIETKLGNPYITQHKYNLSMEHRG